MRTWPALDISRLSASDSETADLLQAALLDYSVAAIGESSADRWQIFFERAVDRDRATEQLAVRFPALAITSADVPDEDWVARSQAGLRAIRVGGIIVAPPWDAPSPAVPWPAGTAPAQDEPLVIIIRPSMGFGTAHHATTRLCLQALQALGATGRAVADVGTGSGVLALAASRLGATRVLGVDDDPDALQAAADNLSLNPGVEVTLRRVDARSIDADPFDLVLANLTGALLAAAAPSLIRLTAPGGHLVMSGLLEEEEATVVAAYAGCVVHNRSQEGEWLCLALRRP